MSSADATDQDRHGTLRTRGANAVPDAVSTTTGSREQPGDGNDAPDSGLPPEVEEMIHQWFRTLMTQGSPPEFTRLTDSLRRGGMWNDEAPAGQLQPGRRNLTNYIARSLLETGGFKPQLHPPL